MKNILINDFWHSNRNHASLQDISSFCKSCGLAITIQDEINLKEEVFTAKEIISIYDFCELIPVWHEKGREVVSNFLKKRS